jgi:hypothetical protein
MASELEGSDTRVMKRALLLVCLLLGVALVGCGSEAPSATAVRAAAATSKPASTLGPTAVPTAATTTTPTPDPTTKPKPTRTPAMTPKPTRTPTVKTATKRQAASAYLAAATRFDRTLNKLETKYGSKSDGTSQRTMQALASKAAGEFIVQIRAIEFPKSNSKAAKALIREAAAYMRAARIASKASDHKVLALYANDAAKAQKAGSRRAATLRQGLGLGRPPADSKGHSGRRF